TALATIQALQSETGEPIHPHAGSNLLIDSMLARSLSGSSARSDLNNQPTRTPEHSETLTQLNEGSISHSTTAETEVTEGPTCGAHELRIDKQDRILIGSDRGTTRRVMIAISAGSLVALLFSCGWIAGQIPNFLGEPPSPQLNKVETSAAPMSAAA